MTLTVAEAQHELRSMRIKEGMARRRGIMPGRRGGHPSKMMLVLHDDIMRAVEAEAYRLHISIQDVIRIVLGEWAEKSV